jgi:catechol 2,3-dioxygenase-like lactoylglutathione lyase family enzyme
MDWKLELIVIPVSDIDTAKDFYVEKMGFSVLMDIQLNPEWRLIHLFPPGSKCGIAIGNAMTDAPPGSSKGMHLMVEDAQRAYEELAGRGVDVNGPYHFVDGAQTPGLHPSRGPFETFLDLADPDGNVWVVQEVPANA